MTNEISPRPKASPAKASLSEKLSQIERLPQPNASTVLFLMAKTFIYVVYSISFQTFFVQAFKIGVDSWKFTMLLLYILWDVWPIFMISGSNEQLQQLPETFHPTKVWLSQLVNFKNAIWAFGHFRRTICNKILF